MRGGSKPGERRGGRQKGTRNKKHEARALAIQLAGIEPKAFLLNGLAFYQGRVKQELARGKDADMGVIERAYAAGREFAKDAAPYCHSRLQAIEHSGSGGGPIEFTFALDHADRGDEKDD